MTLRSPLDMYIMGMFGKSSWWLLAGSCKLVAGGWKLVAVAGS